MFRVIERVDIVNSEVLGDYVVVEVIIGVMWT